MQDRSTQPVEGLHTVANRREFLTGAVKAGIGAVAVDALAECGANAEAAAMQVPLVKVAGVTIPRMIIGCNQIGGWSHGQPNLARATTDYFTLDRTVGFYRDCEKKGLDVCHTYWDQKPLAALKQLWQSGSKMRPYFLGTLESNGGLSKDLLEYHPLWYIHHGNVTDALFRAGKQEQVHDFLKKVHDVLGIPAGISCHNPDCIKYAEDKGWEADLYQTSLYYVTRPQEEIRAKLGAVPLGEPFLDVDRDNMLNVIRQTKKSCLVFKLLAAGRLAGSDDSVEEAFQYTLARIKKNDAVIVGMWPKFKDELAQDLGFVCKYGQVTG